jgi:hypothetical protein
MCSQEKAPPGLSRSRYGLVGNAREKGLLVKPGVPIVCGNSSGNMGDRNRTNWLTVGQPKIVAWSHFHEGWCASCVQRILVGG